MKAESRTQRFFPYASLILILLAGAFVVPVLGERMERLVASFRSMVISGLETAAGYRLAYDSLSPGLLRSIEIRNLRLYRGDGTLLARAGHVSVDYDLATLLAVQDARALSQIHVRDWELSLDAGIDFSGDGGGPDMRTPWELVHDSLSAVLGSLGDELSLRLENGSVTVRAGTIEGRGTVPWMAASVRDDMVELEVPQFSLDLMNGGLPLLKSKFSMEASYGDAAVLYGTIRMDSFENDLFALRSQGFSFSLFPDRVSVKRLSDFAPLDLSLDYAFASGALSARLRAKAQSVSSMVLFRGELGDLLAPYGEIPLDMDLGLAYNVGRGELSYEGSLGIEHEFEPFGKAAIEVGFRGNERGVEVERLSLGNTMGDISLTGRLTFADLSFEGTGAARSALPDGLAEMAANASFSGTPSRIGLSLDLRYGDIGLEGIEVDWWPLRSLLRLKASLPDDEGNLLDIRGELDYTRGLALSMEAGTTMWKPLASSDLAWLLPDLVASARSVLPADSALSFAARYELDRGIWKAELDYLGLDSESQPQRSLEAYGTLRQGAFSLGIQKLAWDGLLLSSTVSGTQAGDNWLISAGISGHGQDIRLAGRLAQDLSGFDFNGNNGLYIIGNRSANGGLDAQLGFESVAFELGAYPARLSARMGLGLSPDGSDWSVSVSSASLLVKGLLPAYPDAWVRLNVQGTIDPEGATIPVIQYVDPVGGLNGSASLSGLFSDQPLLDFELSGPRKVMELNKDQVYQERIKGIASLHADGMDLALEARQLSLRRLGVEGLGGFGNLDCTARGSFDNPVLEADFSLEQGRLSGAALKLDGRLELSRDRMRVKGLSASFLGLTLDNGELEYLSEGETLDLGFGFWQGAERPAKPVMAKASLKLGGISPGGSLELLHFPMSAGSTRDLAFAVQRTDRGWQWSERSGLATVFVRNDGRFLLETRRPFPLAGSAEGALREGAIDLVVSRFEADLSLFAPYLDLGYVAARKGILSGDLRIKGSLQDPSFFGVLQVRNLEGFLELTPRPVTAEQISLILEDKTITLVPATLFTDGIPVEAGGTFILNRSGLAGFTINAGIEDQRGLPVKAAFGIFKVDGRATGKVVISSNGNDLAIRGQVQPFSSVLSLGSETPAAGNDQAADAPFDFKVDLEFTSGKNVEFVWPDRNFPLLRSFIDRNQKVRVAFSTLPLNLIVKGNVSLRGGEVFYLERSFYIKEAAIAFNEENLNFDPYLNARAELRSGSGGTNYRLTLLMENTRLLSPQFSLYSDPPLSSEQIAVLLSGASMERASQLDPGDALYVGADVISRLGFGREVENLVRNILPVDVFSLRTGFFPSLLREALDPSSQPLDNGSYSFGKYFDNTALLLGKFFGNDIYAEFLTQLKAEDPETGVSSPLGLGIELELNMEWNTPFMDILWTFSPRDANSLFLKDNKFTFMWDLQ